MHLACAILSKPPIQSMSCIRLCQILKKKGAMSCIQSRMLIEQHFFPIVCWLVTMINIIFKGHKWAETDPYTCHYGSQEYMKVRITKEMQAKKRNLSLLCINKTQIKTISGGNYSVSLQVKKKHQTYIMSLNKNVAKKDSTLGFEPRPLS